jgi:PAS domain S-box-containing protein
MTTAAQVQTEIEAAERQALIVEASGRLLGAGSLAEVVEGILELAGRALAADAYALWRYVPEDERWILDATAGLSSDYHRDASRAIGGNTANVSLDAPLRVEDIEAVDWLSEEHKRAHRAEGNRSFLVIPIQLGDRILGTLVFYYREPRRFADAEVRTAAALANVASSAIESARLRARQHQLLEERRFLAEAGALLASSLDYELTLANLAALAVPHFADWCAVDMAEDGAIRRIATAHVDPDKVRLAEELGTRYPPDPDAAAGVPNVIRTGEPELVAEIAYELLEEALADTPEYLQAIRELGLRSLMTVPLIARDRPFGAITFISAESGRRYGEEDLALATELAGRAAVAVDNARLYRAAQTSLAEGEAVRKRLAVLADTSVTLASSLDYEETLSNVAGIVVPALADWCAIDLVGEHGRLRRIALVHRDPAKRPWAEESMSAYAPRVDEPEGSARAIRTGEAILYPEIPASLLASSTEDERHRTILEQLGLHSAMVVPLIGRSRTLGALQFASADSTRLYGEDDLEFAKHIARRAAVAVDNALLYREAEEARREAEGRAQAAQALHFVADAVVLVNAESVVKLWNPAAEAITGVAADEAVGRALTEVLPGWSELETRVPVVREGDPGPVRAATLPIEVGGHERWLSISGVRFTGGTVYAFRDQTEERELEQLKSDFVSTVSHELRTPLAAIYGAALTLRREEVRLDEAKRSGMLEVISGEADRLARIVNDILWASRLDSGTMSVEIERCDPAALVRRVVAAAASYAPPNVALSLDVEPGLPNVAADPDKTRQVLTNLVDNAIKYSPDGGEVLVRVTRVDQSIRFEVSDTGLGVPYPEQERIFEKFYRLDPNLTRGVGGTGLGLYISRELVQRMRGRIWLRSNAPRGSILRVELPVAE